VIGDEERVRFESLLKVFVSVWEPDDAWWAASRTWLITWQDAWMQMVVSYRNGKWKSGDKS